MPRWPKSTESFDVKISSIDAKIQRHKEQMEKLEEERSEILTQKRDFEMQELYDFMQSSGMTARGILNMVEPAVAAMNQEQSEGV